MFQGVSSLRLIFSQIMVTQSDFSFDQLVADLKSVPEHDRVRNQIIYMRNRLIVTSDDLYHNVRIGDNVNRGKVTARFLYR